MKINNLCEITEIVGPEKALLLARMARPYGRQNWLYIPTRPERAPHFAEVIGSKAAKELVFRLGGNQLTIGRYDLFERKLLKGKSISQETQQTGQINGEEQLCFDF